jgi:tRNA (mo5U34)-methyltransferase
VMIERSAAERTSLLEEIERLKPWFHCIDLGGGVLTKTSTVAGEPADHPAPTWATVRKFLAADFAGKTVLDVGCNAGFYCVEAKRAGAERVVGVDSQRGAIRQALFVRKALGLDIEFQRMSVYDLSAARLGRFDIVLALGLVYHLKHILLALERLFHVTAGTLIVESAVLPMERELKPFVGRLGGLERRIDLIGYVENPPEAKEAVFNWFVPSREALEALLKGVGFTVARSGMSEAERAIVVCEKGVDAADSRLADSLGAVLAVVEGPHHVERGQNVRIRLDVENTGETRWRSRVDAPGERGVVHLGIHLLDQGGDVVTWDFARADLPGDVEPGQRVALTALLAAPAAPGRYNLEFDMVSEYVTWFEDQGTRPVRYEIIVE